MRSSRYTYPHHSQSVLCSTLQSYRRNVNFSSLLHSQSLEQCLVLVDTLKYLANEGKNLNSTLAGGTQV